MVQTFLRSPINEIKTENLWCALKMKWKICHEWEWEKQIEIEIIWIRKFRREIAGFYVSSLHQSASTLDVDLFWPIPKTNLHRNQEKNFKEFSICFGDGALCDMRTSVNVVLCVDFRCHQMRWRRRWRRRRWHCRSQSIKWCKITSSISLLPLVCYRFRLTDCCCRHTDKRTNFARCKYERK